ncbi:MAG: Fe2+-dependent dioxygenase [Cyanobacteria bacterium J069]|nr:MAG: Fe2+-dependent dioxygenase [Cyanobacteria bacterium J069]
MILCIDAVLTDEELESIATALQTAPFIDGKTTAGWYAQQVKHNMQLEGGTVAEDMRSLVMSALQRNALFQMAAYPKVIRPPLISRYTVGMSYGSHVDNALMGGSFPMRTDLSLTLFLNSPDAYDGGELVIEDTLGHHPFKLAAGAMVLYPATTLHRVAPVTRGTRLVAVTWVQSLVRDAGDRELLFELDTARQSLFQNHGKTPEFDRITKCHANLLRRWVEL